jgi:hypothetical protein
MTKETYYEIKSENNKFNAIIIENKFEYIIRFGGTKECINISVYKDDDKPNINGLSFNSRCSNDENLIPGNGTIEMVKSALKFTKHKFPNLTRKFLFKDYSTIDCLKKIQVRLYYYYLTKYGKTWYQKYFNAKPIKGEFISKINDALNILNDPNKKIEYKDFCKRYLLINNRIRNLDEALKDLYKDSLNYKEFLMNVIKKYPDCGILDSWFGSFWSDICSFNFYEEFWMIKEKEIERWPEVSIINKKDKPIFKRIKQDGGFFYPFGKISNMNLI